MYFPTLRRCASATGSLAALRDKTNTLATEVTEVTEVTENNRRIAKKGKSHFAEQSATLMHQLFLNSCIRFSLCPLWQIELIIEWR